MTPAMRVAGEPSPLAVGTAADDDLPPAIPFDAAAAERIAGAAPAGMLDLSDAIDLFDMPAGTPLWLAAATRLIRPICVGALMAIPTVGAATVGLVALFSGEAATRMTTASTAFLAGIPADVLLLIGALAGGYTLAKTAEKLTGRAR